MARQDPTKDTCKNVAIRILIVGAVALVGWIDLCARLVGALT
jgi:hypothetical protein